MSDSLRPHGLYSPWNSPDQNTGVGSCSLLQGIFLNQESNPALPNCRQILYQLSHQGPWYVHIGLNKILKFISPVFFILGFPGKEPTCQCRRRNEIQFDPYVGKIPWRRVWQPTPVSLTGQSHGQRSLVGYSLRGHKESDTTEQMSTHTQLYMHSLCWLFWDG